MLFSDAQQWALVIVPKITGLISLLFSGLVILTVCISKEKRSKTYHRLLLGISCVDVSSSFWLGLSTWPIPRETNIKWASGTTTSCAIQGFFTQFGIASSFYNASLSVFYLLVIRYGWKEDRVHKLEPYLHSVPIIWGLGTAIAGVPLTIFNSANLWCWIAPYQERGAHADLYRWVFFYGPLWIMILIVTVNVLLIFQHVRRIERAADRYRFRRSSKLSRYFKDEDYQLRYATDNTINVGGEKEGGACLGRGAEEDADNKNTITKGGNNNLILQGDNDNNYIHCIGNDSDINDVDVGIDYMPGSDNEDEDEGGENSDLAVNDDAIISGMVETGDESLVEELPPQSTKRMDSKLSSSITSLQELTKAVSFRGGSARPRKPGKKRRPRSREVANQCLRYAGSFYFTWIALTLTRLLQTINGKTYYPLLIIAATTTPLQGLPNFLVYLAPRFQKARKEMPKAGAWAWLKSSIAPENVVGTSSVARHTSSVVRHTSGVNH